MPIYIRHLLAVASLFSFTSLAHADLIIARPYHDYGITTFSPLPVWIEFTNDFAYSWPVGPLFNRNFAQADTGKTFVADSSTPFFLENMAIATNGINDRIGFMNSLSSGSLAYEAEFFFGAAHNPFFMGKPDLKGFNIDRVTFHVDEMTIVPSSYPDAPPDWMDWTLNGTLAFEGTGSWPPDSPGGDTVADPQGTPEPAGACLAVLGTLGILVARCRKTQLGAASIGVNLHQKT